MQKIGFRTKLILMNDIQMKEKMQDIERVTLELRQIINTENKREQINSQKINELYPFLQILRLLGRGGYGSVYECYGPTNKRSFALKIM